jgi:hypothetical protein
VASQITMSNQFSVSNAKLSFNITEDVHWFTQTSENIEGAFSGNWQDEEKQTKNTTQYVLDTTYANKQFVIQKHYLFLTK